MVNDPRVDTDLYEAVQNIIFQLLFYWKSVVFRFCCRGDLQIALQE